jgi:hypothetical protein
VAYWWAGDRAEKYWVEIRKRPGIGEGLECPTAKEDGRPDAWYELVASVRRGEVIYHWNAREHRFVGRSVAAADAVEDNDSYWVDLEDFKAITADISLKDVRAYSREVYSLHDALLEQHGSPLYLPFQFKQNHAELGFMSNYFAKFPAQLVVLLFGADEVGASRAPALGGTGGFLEPFRPKADTDYLTDVEGGTRSRTRSHETLVNACATWLEARGLSPGRNAAVDLGVSAHPRYLCKRPTRINFQSRP